MFVYKNKKKSYMWISFLIIIIIGFVVFRLFINYMLFYNDINQILISEVCTHNSSVIQDYYGDYSDYIELYNNTNIAIDLSNYCLSDNNNDRNKMSLPNYKIKPGEYYVIFLDNYLSNFKISDNESVFLSIKFGPILKEVTIPSLKINESYSLKTDGSYEISFPTPGSENFVEIKNKELIDEKRIDSLVNASMDSGFYDNPFYVELTSDNDLTIYYTLDSTEPNINSIKYDEPIYIYDRSSDKNVYSSISKISLTNDYIPINEVNKCTILRAVGIDKNGNRTKELIKNYFINYSYKQGYNELPTISLITNPENLFDNENGIYMIGKKYDNYINFSKLKIGDETIFDIINFRDVYFPTNFLFSNSKNAKKAYIYYFNEEINEINDCNISIFGNYSRSYNQKSFCLYNNNTESYLFNIFGESNSLVLRNGGNDTYKSKISDAINQSLFIDRNVVTQQFKPVQVFVDGEYWGVYILQERVDKNLISRRFDINEEDVVLIKRNNVIDDNQDLYDDFKLLLDFIKNKDMSKKKNYNYVKSKIDIQSFIDLRCFEIYVNRYDGTNAHFNNIGIWKLKDNKNYPNIDNKYKFILYDTDSPYEFEDIINEDYFVSLLKNDEFKQQFVISYMDVINNNFKYEKVHDLIENYRKQIELSVVESHKRFYKEDYSLDDYHKEINKMDIFFKNEKDLAISSLIDDLSIEDPLYKVTVNNINNIDYAINTINTNENFIGEYFSTYPITLSSNDDSIKGWNVNGKYYNGNTIEVNLQLDTVIDILYK